MLKRHAVVQPPRPPHRSKRMRARMPKPSARLMHGSVSGSLLLPHTTAPLPSGALLEALRGPTARPISNLAWLAADAIVPVRPSQRSPVFSPPPDCPAACEQGGP
ncbi:hypothetical protein ACJQWK_06807 [Exserohilum turcicum]